MGLYSLLSWYIGSEEGADARGEMEGVRFARSSTLDAHTVVVLEKSRKYQSDAPFLCAKQARDISLPTFICLLTSTGVDLTPTELPVDSKVDHSPNRGVTVCYAYHEERTFYFQPRSSHKLDLASGKPA